MSLHALVGAGVDEFVTLLAGSSHCLVRTMFGGAWRAWGGNLGTFGLCVLLHACGATSETRPLIEPAQGHEFADSGVGRDSRDANRAAWYMTCESEQAGRMEAFGSVLTKMMKLKHSPVSGIR